MIEKYVTPKELKRLVSALLVVLGFISLNALFGFLIVPALRLATRGPADPAVKTPQGQTGWLDPAEFPAEARRVVPPIDPNTVMKPSPELLAKGKNLYEATCAACHGSTGKGDGPAAAGLPTKPRVFAQAAGWKNGPRMDGLWKTLDQGLPGTSMQSYSYLSKKDRMALVHHIQTMATFDRGAEDPKALEGMARLFASAGEVIPNRIPVSSAIRHLALEAEPIRPLAPAAGLSSLVVDPLRAAQALAGIPGWRDSDKALAEGVVRGLPANGFAPRTATLTPDQWKALRADLVAAAR